MTNQKWGGRAPLCPMVSAPMLYSVADNDISHRAAVDCEQQWSKDESLRYADVELEDW